MMLTDLGKWKSSLPAVDLCVFCLFAFFLKTEILFHYSADNNICFPPCHGEPFKHNFSAC